MARGITDETDRDPFVMDGGVMGRECFGFDRCGDGIPAVDDSRRI